MENEKKNVQVGVFMDHAEASFFIPNKKEKHTIISGIKHHERIKGESGDSTRLGNFRSTNNENHKHNIEQNDLHLYFKALAAYLNAYDEIFIIGPTTAPTEFQSYCLKHKLLHGKRISVKKSDYLTDNQIEEKINAFFKSPVY